MSQRHLYKLVLHCMLSAAVLSSQGACYAADDVNQSAPQAGDAARKTSAENGDLQALKQQLAEQKGQIEELRLLLLDQKKQIDNLRAQPAAVVDAAPAPLTPAQAKYSGIGLVASTTPVVPPSSMAATISAVSAISGSQAAAAEQPSPLQIKLGNATITPVGFMDLTNTWRSTNAGTSLQTNFGSFPYNTSVAGRLTEDKFSAENSRIGFRVDANVKGVNVLGYYEGDFVGGVTGNNTQVSSNSMLYRIRQYYVDVRKGFWEVLAGQAWSMIVPNRKGMSPLPSDLFYSQVVDVNYTNGLYWGRIPGIRFIGHPSNKVTFGVALENATQYFGGSGGGGVPTLPAALATTYNSEVDNSVNNDRSLPNVHPDIIAKLVLEPSSKFHFEVSGVASTVKTFNPLTSQYFTKTGGAGTVALNVELAKNFRLVTNNFYSDGAGRYLFGEVPNFIVRADGSPSLMHSASTVSGFEATIKKFAPYIYYGGVYAGRNTAWDANGTTRIGYGYTGSPNSQNRSIQELTFGWTQTLWRDGKYGALQYMAQYAYLFRNPWYVAPNAPKGTHESVIWFNLRYVLPGTAPTIQY